MDWIRENGWATALASEREHGSFAALEDFIEREYATKTVFPPKEKIFAAFEATPLSQVRVVILGQDPYHEPGEAQGLAFYVPEGIKTPPSLVNIAKELRFEREGTPVSQKLDKRDIPDLRQWAAQGVLLLNTTLTVVAGQPLSHAKHGWEEFTDRVIALLNSQCDSLVFLLWGAHAQKKGAAIDRTRHLVIECAHPSPLSARRGFFGSNCFSRVNDYLKNLGQPQIFWTHNKMKEHNYE